MIQLLAATTTTTIATKTSSSGGLLDPIAKPIAWVLAHIYAVVPNYGVAIMVLSLAWMILIAPLTLKTTRSMLAMQRLAPEIKKLQDKHRNDRAALSQATMDLYKEHNVSPFGSCLPTLLPLPIFFALFRVIDGLSHHANGLPAPKYLSHSTKMYSDIVRSGGQLKAFGVDLAKNALSPHGSFGATLPYFILLLVMMGTQYFQTVQMMNRNPANANNPQAKMMKYLPLVFGFIFIRLPAGVILYYAMSNVCRITQQTLMYRYDPKVKALAAQDIQEIEAETRDIETGKRKREPSVPAQAPRSRFRDMLANEAKAREERLSSKRAAGAGTNGAKPKAGAPSGKATKPPAKAIAKPPAKPGGAPAAKTNGSTNGSPPSGARTGAGSGSPGRTGAARNQRNNKKRRGR